VLGFAVTAGALALLAMIVGDATEQLGSRMGPGATGILLEGLALIGLYCLIAAAFWWG
jgi:Ca2+:H+ antiporter